MIRTLWATAALLAIVAMHGLAAHAGPPDASPLPAASASHAEHTDHTVHTDLAATAAVGSTAGAAPSHGEHGHETAVMGLCAAVLATSAILLLTAFGRPRSGVLGLVPRAATTLSRPVRMRVTYAPPDLHALSVLRC